MKYAIIIPDGCADDPLEVLGGKTPMQAAETPTLDELARCGVVGRSFNCPMSMEPGSDVANLSLLGYNPLKEYTGRAPLEAAASGIELGDNDWAFRCNMVTLADGCMQSFTAGHIASEDSAALLASLQEHVDGDRLRFEPGVSYRNLLICRGDSPSTFPIDATTYAEPPHNLTGRPIADEAPRGPGSDWVLDLIETSRRVFADHPVNKKRIAEGKKPATNVWLWGHGRRPSLESFSRRFNVGNGAMITGVDLLRGLANLLGWEIIDVPGATGYTDTDYAAKGRYACDALDRVDLVCVHVEATDEAGHEGDYRTKLHAFEEIDKKIVAPVLEKLRSLGDHRILVSPDHPTPVGVMTHTHNGVPWVIAGTGIDPDNATAYDEATGDASAKQFEEGWRLMPFFIGRD